MKPNFVLRGALWLYGQLMAALVPLLRLKLRRRGKQEPGYLQHIEQRLGHYPGVPPSSGGVWIHAVSLGETRAAGILLNTLREKMPGLRVVLTTGTATGRAEGKGLLRDGDVQVWQPWDTPEVVHRFLSHFQPRMGILLETEVWPHWVEACVQCNVPLYLVNARLSPQSLRKALAQRWLAFPAYGRLHGVLAQTEADAARFRQLSAPVQGVMGNLKYDVQVDPVQQARGMLWRQSSFKPVIMLASSREGEEQKWLQTLNHLGAAAETVQWLVVPRHPQRFEHVASLIDQAGWSVSRRSQWASDLPPAGDSKTIWLGDSLGEMQAYYHLAHVAWLGGSFEPLGGQNLIEAAACACPVVMGPHTFNFSDAARQAEQVGAAVRVSDMHEAWLVSLSWLEQKASHLQAQKASLEFISKSQGAAKKCIEFLG